MELKKYKLGDVLSEFHSGKSIIAESIKSFGKYPVFGANGLRGYTDTYNHDGETVIIGRQGAYCGNVKYYSGEAYYTEHAIIAKTKSFVNAKYLSALLPFYKLEKYQGQSAQPGLSVETISKIDIYLPDIELQNRHAKLLSALDRKIALNRAINRNLEAMAKQLYDYWFVQFDFPNAEGKPYKSSGGKMVWNETLKREIPEGWEVTRLDKMTSSVNGGEWGEDACSDKSPVEIHCLRGADFKDTYKAPTRYISPKKKSKCLSEFDLVVEISGGSPTQATGRSVFITKELLDFYDGKLTCTNFCQSVSFDGKQLAIYFNYVWNMFYENDIMFNFEGKTSGLKNLQMDVILKEQWYVPTGNLLERFHNKVLPMLQTMEKNKQQNNSLAAQRDSLLPLLVNGQVTIK